MTIKAIVTVSLALAASWAGVARAENSQHPAAFCNVADGSTGLGSTGWAGDIWNKSSSGTLRLVCPVAARTDLGTIRQASVTMRDRNCALDTKCTFAAQWLDPDGTTWFYETGPMNTTGCGTHRQTASTAVNFGTGHENLAFKCTVPAAEVVGTDSRTSALFSYTISR
jgi:hypothetical protein